jgi:uncharacterized protein (DUF433 family)
MSEELLKRITSDPAICGGRPRVNGTRMRVMDILELLAAGASHAEILEDYPYIQADDIRACLIYAARNVEHPDYRVAA